MKKYELLKEKFEMKAKTKSYTTGEILGKYWEQNCFQPEILASFDTLEEARTAFEKAKESCMTRVYSGNLMEADVLLIQENEYDDDDGELIGGGDCWNEYAEAYVIEGSVAE